MQHHRKEGGGKEHRQKEEENAAREREHTTAQEEEEGGEGRGGEEVPSPFRWYCLPSPPSDSAASPSYVGGAAVPLFPPFPFSVVVLSLHPSLGGAGFLCLLWVGLFSPLPFWVVLF